MLVVVTEDPTIFGEILTDWCVPLAADESLIEVNQRIDMGQFLVESEIAPPPSAGLFVLECEVEKVKEGAPEGLRATLIKWRHPTHEEIGGLLAAQGLHSQERSRKRAMTNVSWTFLGSLF